MILLPGSATWMPTSMSLLCDLLSCDLLSCTDPMKNVFCLFVEFRSSSIPVMLLELQSFAKWFCYLQLKQVFPWAGQRVYRVWNLPQRVQVFFLSRFCLISTALFCLLTWKVSILVVWSLEAIDFTCRLEILSARLREQSRFKPYSRSSLSLKNIEVMLHIILSLMRPSHNVLNSQERARSLRSAAYSSTDS